MPPLLLLSRELEEPLPLFGRGRFSRKSEGREDAPGGLMEKFQEGGRKRKGIPEEKEEEEKEEEEET